jgi:hypothetical protein
MSSRGLSLPDSTRERLEQFRQRVRVVKIAEGILAGLFGLVLSYLAVFIIDRFIDTSALFRTSLLLSGSVGLAVLFPLKCHRWVWGTRSMEQVARLLKHKFPALGDQLLGIVELAHSDKDLGSSTRLAQAAIDQVDSVVRSEISPTRFLDRSIDSGRRRSQFRRCWRFLHWRLCQQQASTRCLAG